ncbi:hypothetical protein GP486_008545, partial [Trichoglossum hirsutum]
MSGISVLRDGFRVRSPGDWLGLSSEMTSGSTYGLRVDNTIGYFALTGEFNYGLTEKSDREGFVEDAHYRGFHQIARLCRKFASDAMENVRRSLDEHARKLIDAQPAGQVPLTDPLDEVEKVAKASTDIKAIADKATEDLQRGLMELEQVDREGPVDPEVSRMKAMQLANAAIAAIDRVREDIVPNSSQNAAIRRLRQSVEDRQEQMVSLYESAAVGLSARGLAHELRTHLAEIRQKATAIQNASKGGLGEHNILPLIRSIRSSCTAISNAAALIDPMLPRSRSLRDEFDVNEFVSEYLENRTLSFEKSGVRAVHVPIGGQLRVRVNRPRLLQVLDNLTRNSTYWLRRGSLLGQAVTAPTVTIEVNRQGFTIWDNGPGVDPHVEESLFEIFVTTKPDPSAGQ